MISEEYELMSRLELFEALDSVELKRLIFVSNRYHLDPGEYLFKQGDNTNNVFGILEGTFSVLLSSVKGEITIAERSSGDLIGEMAVISGEPRNASMRAETACEVIEFDSNLFISTVTNNPQTALKMMKMLSARLVRLNQVVQEQSSN